ncbi:hypothetical protein GCM10023213_25410 [Prosthecobacter algae]|uniref:Uncharacterized protein n=1 Tax=Prosthecobacter algae TaxID=1144682 RepID=A0ABP9PCF5_9BACT
MAEKGWVLPCKARATYPECPEHTAFPGKPKKGGMQDARRQGASNGKVREKMVDSMSCASLLFHLRLITFTG